MTAKLQAASRIALIVPCAMLASCRDGVLDPHGPIGLSERLILSDATAVMLAVVIPVIVLALAFAWWFRADNHLAKYTPDWEYSGRIELIIWAIPALLIGFLGGMTWITAHDLDPPKPLVSKHAPVEIEVVSLDWRWLFIYPGHCDRESADGSGRSADPFPTHFHQCHEQFLRPAAG
jgi:cytochrome o ubiquinol oxidase subunit 2